MSICEALLWGAVGGVIGSLLFILCRIAYDIRERRRSLKWHAAISRIPRRPRR